MSDAEMQPSSSPKEVEEPLPRFIESKPLAARLTSAGRGKVILAGVLALILAGMLLQLFIGAAKKRPAQATPHPVSSGSLAAVPPEPAAQVVQETAAEEGDRDSPFSLAPQPEPERGPVMKLPVLQGILTDASGESLAVINEKIVKKGERVADNIIKAIEADSVLLQKDSGEEWTLRMKT